MLCLRGFELYSRWVSHNLEAATMLVLVHRTDRRKK